MISHHNLKNCIFRQLCAQIYAAITSYYKRYGAILLQNMEEVNKARLFNVALKYLSATLLPLVNVNRQ